MNIEVLKRCEIFRVFSSDGVTDWFTKKYRKDPDGFRSIIKGATKHTSEEIYHLGIKVDWNGKLRDVDIDNFFSTLGMYRLERQYFVDRDHVIGEPSLQDFIDGHVWMRCTSKQGSYRSQCSSCGEHIGFEIRSDSITIMSISEEGEWSTDQCSPINLVTLNMPVPSGRILYGDFLGPFKGEDGFETGNADINTHHGQVEAILHNYQRNMIAFSVGNSCPGVYKAANGQYLLCSGINVSVEDVEDEWFVSEEQAVAEGGEYDPNVHQLLQDAQVIQDQFGGKIERVGGICTDLWWASFMDEELAEKYLDLEDGRAERDALEVEPGMYEFSIWTIKSPYAGDDGDYGRVYATFKRRGDL